MKTHFSLAALALSLAAGPAQAQDSITAVTFGGTATEAQKEWLYAPFTAETGVAVVSDEYNGELAKIKAMVDSRNVVWSVVQAEGLDVLRYCEEGLFERLDWAELGVDPAGLIDDAARDCGSGVFVWGIALAWNADRLNTAPTGWADFWDTQKFPGKRGLRKRAIYNLEFALMADGVAPQDVYTLLATRAGQDRAFAKLDELKPHIQWWEAGAQPPQWLVAGDVVMSSSYQSRIAYNHAAGYNLDLTWAGGMYGMDYWAIPKGAANQDAIRKFIAFAARPDIQQQLAEHLPNAPTSLAASANLPPQIARWLPTSPENLAVALAIGDAFWADWGEELEARFNAWMAR